MRRIDGVIAERIIGGYLENLGVIWEMSIESIFHQAKSKGPLYALFLNCTLKQSRETSNTEALCNLLVDRLKAHEPDIETEIVRVADYNILPGISNDEGEGDEWPEILEKVKRCNIFIPKSGVHLGNAG